METHGNVGGDAFNYYCSNCQATEEPSHDGTGPGGNFYCINGGSVKGLAPDCTCSSCDEGFGGPNCASCPLGMTGRAPDECVVSNCVATSVTSDDGTDGNFYCINGGTPSGTAGTCTCSCAEGFSGTHCQSIYTEVNTMTAFFNAVSNHADANSVDNTGTNLMTNGEITVVADGHYKCSEGTCAATDKMVVLRSMWGEVKCNSDAATCTLDGEDSHIVMAISGFDLGDNVLTVRAFTVTKGRWANCGGIGVSGGAIVDIILCIFIGNEPLAAGAGAIGVLGGEGENGRVYDYFIIITP